MQYNCLSIDPVLITDPVFQRHTWFLSFLALQFGFILFSRWTPRFETDSESKRKFFHPKNRSFHGIRPQMKAIAHMSVPCRYKTCWPWDFLWNDVFIVWLSVLKLLQVTPRTADDWTAVPVIDSTFCLSAQVLVPSHSAPLVGPQPADIQEPTPTILHHQCIDCMTCNCAIVQVPVNFSIPVHPPLQHPPPRRFQYQKRWRGFPSGSNSMHTEIGVRVYLHSYSLYTSFLCISAVCGWLDPLRQEHIHRRRALSRHGGWTQIEDGPSNPQYLRTTEAVLACFSCIEPSHR